MDFLACDLLTREAQPNCALNFAPSLHLKSANRALKLVLISFLWCLRCLLNLSEIAPIKGVISAAIVLKKYCKLAPNLH